MHRLVTRIVQFYPLQIGNVIRRVVKDFIDYDLAACLENHKGQAQFEYKVEYKATGFHIGNSRSSTRRHRRKFQRNALGNMRRKGLWITRKMPARKESGCMPGC
jgi:hypothetical protein